MIVSRNNIDHIPHCLVKILHINKYVSTFKETHLNNDIPHLIMELNK